LPLPYGEFCARCLPCLTVRMLASNSRHTGLLQQRSAVNNDKAAVDNCWRPLGAAYRRVVHLLSCSTFCTVHRGTVAMHRVSHAGRLSTCC
jgi:hypothetical protein